MSDFSVPFAHANAVRGPSRFAVPQNPGPAKTIGDIPCDRAERFSHGVLQPAPAGEFAHVSAEEHRATIRRIEAARRLEAAETVRLRTSLEARIAQLEITVKALVERG